MAARTRLIGSLKSGLGISRRNVLIWFLMAVVMGACWGVKGGGEGEGEAQDSSSSFHRLLKGLSGVGDGNHKPFWPLAQEDLLTIALATLGLVVAAGGGIGGGGILVPLYILVLDFNPKRAIPLSNVTILGGAIANVIAGALNSHPIADRPLLDWDLILMMEPTTIIGAVVGSFANKVLPEIVISVLLVIVLALLANRTLRKGLHKLDQEGGIGSLCAVGGEGDEEEEEEIEPVEDLKGRDVGTNTKVDESSSLLASTPGGAPAIDGVRQPKRSHSSNLRYAAINRNAAAIAGGGGGGAIVSTSLTSSGSISSSRGASTGKDNESEKDVPWEILSTRSPSLSLAVDRIEGSKARAALSRRFSSEGDDAPALLENGGNNGHLKAIGATGALGDILERERTTSLWKPLTLTLCFLGIVTIDILKGGEGTPSPLGFKCGTPGYWLVTLSAIPWVLIFFFAIRAYILKDHQAKVAAGYAFVMGDIAWTPSSTIHFPLICITAGLFAGIFGVGGGIVKGPLMLEMGVLPPVAAASAATMILFTSAAASAAYYTFGLIPMDYGLFFFVWGFICTACGQIIVNHLLVKYKKESFIILSIGGVILLSTFLMGFQSITDYIKDPAGVRQFGSLCFSPPHRN